eukprot:6154667-Amphidinium_carterae.1
MGHGGPAADPQVSADLSTVWLWHRCILEGPHRRVVVYKLNYNSFARCLDCGRQTGKVHGKFNFPYLMRQECRRLKKNFAQRQDAVEDKILHPKAELQDLHPVVDPHGIG